MIIRRSKRKKKIISIRSKFGKKETHELLIFRSNLNIYGYISSLIDGRVLFSVSTLTLAKGGKKVLGTKVEKSSLVGKEIGIKCKELDLKPAINVAQYKYHGRVKSLVESFKEFIK